MDKEVIEKYGDIIDLPRHEPDKLAHPRMTVYNRAAQFAPFAALTGYEEAVKESARLTNRKIPLDDCQINHLTKQLHNLQKQIANRPKIMVTYFEHDKNKPGGEYVSYTGTLKQIIEHERKLIFTSDKIVKINDLHSIIERKSNL